MLLFCLETITTHAFLNISNARVFSARDSLLSHSVAKLNELILPLLAILEPKA